MDNNTVTITIDRFEKLVRDSQKLAVLSDFRKLAIYGSDIKALLDAIVEGGNEDA